MGILDTSQGEREYLVLETIYFMATIILSYFEDMLCNINTLKVIVMPKYFTV